MNNEELVSIYEDVDCTLKLALNELNDVEEYKEVFELIKEARNTLEAQSEEYIEEYRKECDEELRYQDYEYMRSVL